MGRNRRRSAHRCLQPKFADAHRVDRAATYARQSTRPNRRRRRFSARLGFDLVTRPRAKVSASALRDRRIFRKHISQVNNFAQPSCRLANFVNDRFIDLGSSNWRHRSTRKSRLATGDKKVSCCHCRRYTEFSPAI